VADLVFGKVPHPDYLDRPITKQAGFGMSEHGKRNVKGVVLHRMIGTLWGTDGWFRRADVPALTDYGVGVAATDGIANDGVIIRWNNPLGFQSGWASGPISDPYGDGRAFLAKYGGDAVNRDQVSVEISGNYDTAFSEKAKRSVAWLIAYWADQYHIPWDVFPIAPNDGFSFIRWHREFTIGTGKPCPGKVVMDATNDLIERARTVMKAYQTGVGVVPAQPPTPPVRWANPVLPDWWTKEELAKGIDRKIGNTTLYACRREVETIKRTKCLAWAGENAPQTRPPVDVRDRFRIEFVFATDDGKKWVITHHGSRIAADAVTPAITIRPR